MEITVPSGDSFDPDSHFLFWKPDSLALVEPKGMPWRLDPGNDLILNMHLKPTGKPETVDATIGLYFADEPATEHPMLLQLEHDAALDIPANDANFVVEDQLKLPVDVLPCESFVTQVIVAPVLTAKLNAAGNDEAV